MSNYTDKTTGNPALEDFPSALEQALHKGAQAMLQFAIELEVQQYIGWTRFNAFSHRITGSTKLKSADGKQRRALRGETLISLQGGS